jgi:hypothetical protein
MADTTMMIQVRTVGGALVDIPLKLHDCGDESYAQAAALVERGRTRISGRVAVAASQTGATVWAPASGQKFVLRRLVVSAKTAGDIQFFDATDSGNTVVTPIVSLTIGGGFVLEWPADMPYRSAAADNILKYTTGTVITGSIYCEGWEE